MNDWCHIINSAYSDAEYNNQSAKSFLLKHPFLSDIRTFFVCESNERIATISVGVYSQNRNVGGFCRIAVLPSYQRKGIGVLLLSIGEKELADRNISNIQEAILLKRVPSLRMHFSVGYLPEKSSKERACKRTGKWKLLIQIYDYFINKLTFKEYKKYLRGVNNKNHV